MATKDQDALQLATDAYHKLLPHSTVPIRNIIVRPHSFTIDKRDIKITVSIGCVVHTSVMARNSPTSHAPPSNNSNDKSRDEQIHKARSDGIAGHNYAVDRIVQHVAKRQTTRYVVRLYIYTQAENTVEAAVHISQHFLARYWKRVSKQNRR